MYKIPVDDDIILKLETLRTEKACKMIETEKKEKMWDKEIFIKYKPKYYYQNILKNSKFKHQYLYEPYIYFKLHLF